MGAERWFLDYPLTGLGQGDRGEVHGETHNRCAFSVYRAAARSGIPWHLFCYRQPPQNLVIS